MSEAEKPDLTSLAVQLLSAYLSNNTVESSELPGLIRSTRAALAEDKASDAPAAPEFVAATTVRKSLASRDHIVSMIDGKSYKTLKRHLATHGLTPPEYRERYKLPRDYPMVAPGYSEQRRAVAQRLGLGRKSPSTKSESKNDKVPQAAADVAVKEADRQPVAAATGDIASAVSGAPAKTIRKSRKSESTSTPRARGVKEAAADDTAQTKPVRRGRSKPVEAAHASAPKARRGQKAAAQPVVEAS